ncbi:hypothetical protein Btru_009484 [Bulinus truncatus]|nr:hypothetical protein Btru_009484 [Bulinus truncatus]
MAETDQDTGLLNGTARHSDVSNMIDTTHVQVDHDGMSEELLRQALAEANAFESVTYAVAGNVSEVCDTGQGSAEVNGDLSVNSIDNGTETHLSTNTEGVLVHNSGNLLNGSSEAIFTNGTSNVLGVQSNENFTVDISSLPEGHIISIPSDIMSGSVVIPESQEDHLQQSVISNEHSHLQDDAAYMQENDSRIVTADTNVQLSQNETFTHPNTVTVSAPNNIQMSQEILQNVIQQVQAQQQALAAQKTQLTDSSNSQQETISFTLVSPSQPNSSSPPLGSSQNPIRIIQQGNRYTPMQQLTTEQLQQIMQVVQQQHVTKNSQDNSGSVIFNPQTNTRIMYRVIYPSELHKSQNATTYHVLRPSTATQEQQTANSQHKRPYRKRKDISNHTGGYEEEDKDKSVSDTPELSKEEKEERKKHRPRTRSGRVSKPPKHMVQDYKHIHVLDWDEDYDDSDGGYSDFKHSDEEEKIKQEAEDESLASPELSSDFTSQAMGRVVMVVAHVTGDGYSGYVGDGAKGTVVMLAMGRVVMLMVHVTGDGVSGYVGDGESGNVDGTRHRRWGDGDSAYVGDGESGNGGGTRHRRWGQWLCWRWGEG